MNVEQAPMFPRGEDLLPGVGLAAPIVQREYLVNGEIRSWSGATREVRSPIWLETDAGPVPRVIGAFPLLGETEALAALDAAVAAYDGGRGAWPTRSVAERISHVEDFVHRLTTRREEIVRLLMWEIG